MIVARHYGWGAITERPMDYGEFLLALQLLAEERTGSKVREAKRREDSKWDSAHQALKR